MDAPTITIFVRHSEGCPNAGDEFYKRCDCWKHIRWTDNKRQHRRATKSKTWAGAERFKREVELSYEVAGKPAESNRPATVRQSVETFIRDKQGQNLGVGALGKFRRELARLVQFCERRGKFYLPEIGLPDLTEFRSTWNADFRHPSPAKGFKPGCGLFFATLTVQGLFSATPPLICPR